MSSNGDPPGKAAWTKTPDLATSVARGRPPSGADRRITRKGNPRFDSAGSTDDPPARFAAKKRPRAPEPLPLLTLPEAAEILKVSVKQVRRYIAIH